MLRLFLAGFHLLALALGVSAVLYRGSVLRESISNASLRQAFKFDTMWGITAALWIVTGVWRLLAQTEKPLAYYMHNSFFTTKMALFLGIFLLEIWPMIMLIRWRAQLRKGLDAASFVPSGAAKKIAHISHIEALLVVIMVFLAAGMARGFGA